MLTCRDLTRLVASDQVSASPWSLRLGARLHLLLCRHCSRYVAQLRRLGSIARKGHRQSKGDPAALRRLEQSILARLPDRSSGPAPPDPASD